MWIAECKIDNRGRITLPSTFMRANELDNHTKVFIQTIMNNSNTVKLVFMTNKEEINGQSRDISNSQ
jgi:hypothetical protein|tara:strand:- start:6893 stop:7093 length:201 start_codon:yes stop_codon:yes gene_type:complete